MRKSVFGFALVMATAATGGCGPDDVAGTTAVSPLRGMGYGGTNSHVREGGVLGGVRVTGFYRSQAAQTGTGTVSPTSWWVSTTGTDLYAPILAITYQSQRVSDMASDRGVLQVSFGGALQAVETLDSELLFEVGEPINSTMRISGSLSGSGYTKYVTESYSNETGAWESFCPHPYAQADGTITQIPEYVIPVAGAKWFLNGSQTADASAIRLSCTHDFVGGCIEWGYAPWKTTASGASMKETHQACGRMKREDICGDGNPYTTSGLSYSQHTQIELWDTSGVHAMLPHTSTTMEAGWSASGATCFTASKYRSNDPVLAQRLQILLTSNQCPKPACSDKGAPQGIMGSARPCTAVDLAGKCIAN